MPGASIQFVTGCPKKKKPNIHTAAAAAAAATHTTNSHTHRTDTHRETRSLRQERKGERRRVVCVLCKYVRVEKSVYFSKRSFIHFLSIQEHLKDRYLIL